METRATLRGVRLSVDKGRLVADLIRGKKSRPSPEHPAIHTEKSCCDHQEGSGVGYCQC